MRNEVQLTDDQAPEHNFRAREHAAAVRRAKLDIAASVVALGRRSLIARKVLPKDAWRRWLWENFGWQPSQAGPYIRIAKRLNRPGAESIDPDAMLLLAVGDASPRVVRAAAEAARRRRHVTVEVAKGMLERSQVRVDSA